MLLVIPNSVNAITREEYNNVMVKVGLSSATTYQDDFVYTYRWAGTPENPIDKMSLLNNYLAKAKQGIKIQSGYIYGSLKKEAGIQGSFKNKFPVYCGSYVHLLIYHVSGGRVTMNDYETIPVSQMKKGDLIHFKNHIAVYLDDGGDNSGYTWNVIEASGKVKTGICRQPTDGIEGFRIKESALSKLDYNTLFASYDYHDRLDDYSPIITSVQEVANTNKITIVATDYKHYDLSEHSDILEPENHGIVAYQVKTTSSIPTTDWKSVTKTDRLSVTHEVSGNGKYYVFVKDVGGNVTTKEVTLTKIVVDKAKPTLGTFSYEGRYKSLVVNVNNAKDNYGIKEYRFYINGKLVATTTNKTYEITSVEHNKIYSLYYEVVDIYGNINTSAIYEVSTQVDAASIEVDVNNLELLKGETFRLSPKISASSNNYVLSYKSSNEKVCTVDNNGLIKAIDSGNCNVSISVGNTTVKVNVKVTTIKVEFILKELPVSYVDEEYSVLIETNPQGVISLVDSKLPDGLVLEENYIKGKPTEKATGTHNIKVLSTYNDSKEEITYTLKVNYKVEIEDLALLEYNKDDEYNESILMNYPGKVTLKSGRLPKGLTIEDNTLSGIPTEEGEFTFILKGEYKDSTVEKKITITVKENDIVPNEEDDYVDPADLDVIDENKENEKTEIERPVVVPTEKKSEPNYFIIIFSVVMGLVVLTIVVEILLSNANKAKRRYR